MLWKFKFAKKSIPLLIEIQFGVKLALCTNSIAGIDNRRIWIVLSGPLQSLCRDVIDWSNVQSCNRYTSIQSFHSRKKKHLFSLKYWYDGMPHTHTHKNQTFGISSFDDSDRLWLKYAYTIRANSQWEWILEILQLRIY